MHFTSILTGFVILLLGSSDPALAVSLGLPRSSSIEHHRRVRQTDSDADRCAKLKNPSADCQNDFTAGSCAATCAEHRVVATESSDPVLTSEGCPVEGGDAWVSNNVQNNKTCYYFSSDASPTADTANWDGAKVKCQDLGTDLGTDGGTVDLAEVSFNIESDEWLLNQIREKKEYVWLGARKTTNGAGWTWPRGGAQDTGRSLTLISPYWGPDQPNDKNGDQDCLSTIESGNGEDQSPKRQYLNDEKCTELRHYVCQFFANKM